MADPKRVGVDSGGLSGIASLLDLLGGQKSSSTTTSDTGALQGLLGQLQGINYDNVLKSIFTQAGGQIPGLTAGLSNSIGARTGGNSAVSTVLGKLLESTTMKAADRTAQLQQGNQALQAQVASGIAGGNKSTTQTSGTNTGKAAQNLAILQLGSKLLGSDPGKGLLAKGKGLYDNLFSGSTTPGSELSSVGSSLDFNSPGVGMGGDQFNVGFGSADTLGGGFGSLLDAGGSIGDFAGDLGSSAAGDFGSAAGDLASSGASDIPLEDISGFFGMADGGLVGRDEKPVEYPMGGRVKGPVPTVGDQGYADGGRVEPKVGTKGPVKSGGTGGGLSKESTSGSNSGNQAAIVLVIDPKDLDSGINPRKTNSLREEKAGLADGGLIRSGGGRRSSAVSYDPLRPEANAAVQSPRSALNPRREELAFEPLPIDSGPGQSSNPTSIGSINPEASVAVGNAVGNAIGNATMSAVVGPIGMLGINAVAPSLGISTPQSALSQTIAAIAEALGLGTSVNPDGTSSTSPTATGTSSVADAANADTSDSGVGDAGVGDGTSGDSSSGVGDSGNSGGTGAAGGDGSTGYSRGGSVRGQGTGTSDSIPANLSKGEYVIPADVVQSLGVRFFDELKNHFHTPADIQNGR